MEKTVGRVCPQCGRVLEESFVVCPYCGKSLTITSKEEKPRSKGGLGAGIASVICVVVGFFAFGIILSIVAMITGATALTRKGATGKVLGAIGLIGGVLEFIVTLLVLIGLNLGL